MTPLRYLATLVDRIGCNRGDAALCAGTVATEDRVRVAVSRPFATLATAVTGGAQLKLDLLQT